MDLLAKPRQYIKYSVDKLFVFFIDFSRERIIVWSIFALEKKFVCYCIKNVKDKFSMMRSMNMIIIYV